MQHDLDRPPTYGEMSPETYKTYLDERNRLSEVETSYGKEFDKYILTLGGGAIALSLAFLRDFIGSNSAANVGWLVSAWIGLSVAVVVTIVGLLVNPSAQARFREILDEQAQLGGEQYWTRVRLEQSKVWGPWAIRWLNRAGVSAFVIGLMCLLAFALTNVSKKGVSMSDGNKDGVPLKTTDRPLELGRPPARSPVDRVQTVSTMPDGKAGAPPAMGPVDRPVPTAPASQPAGTPPPTSGK